MEPSRDSWSTRSTRTPARGSGSSSEKLKKYFSTDDHAKAALEVLKRGELNLTQEQRKRLTEEKRKAIIAAISKNFVDPRTSLPHPPTRIEQAMQEARVNMDPFQDVERADKDCGGEPQDHPTPEVGEGEAFR